MTRQVRELIKQRIENLSITDKLEGIKKIKRETEILEYVDPVAQEKRKLI